MWFKLYILSNENYKTRNNEFNINLSNMNNKSIRVENKILINFDNYFKWPTLNDNEISNGYCYGLKSQIGILANGTVVPCCLDSFGIIDLGNLNNRKLEDILYSEKTMNIVNGFKENKAIEELCQKCTFKHRFN